MQEHLNKNIEEVEKIIYVTSNVFYLGVEDDEESTPNLTHAKQMLYHRATSWPHNPKWQHTEFNWEKYS